MPSHPHSTTLPFDVLALVTSAGGVEAVSAVLADLPAGLPAAVLVGQHLKVTSALVEILSRRSRLPVQWVESGTVLEPGRIYVSPPHTILEVLPDRSCALTPLRGLLLEERPLDRLLASLADSFGARVLSVVLTGMAHDGAAGARAVRDAGGAVLVQSPDTAAHADMPRAAIEAGAADLVLPLQNIGRTAADLLAGGRFPQPRNEAEIRGALFAGSGPAREALRGVDWEATPLGPVMGWSESLKVVLASVLHSRFPTCIFWGEEFVQLYNDAWVSVLGHLHPRAMGLPAWVSWNGLWASQVATYRTVLEIGEATYAENQPFELNRHGFVEEAYFTSSMSPLRDDRGAVRGVITVVSETTAQVLSARRMAALRALTAAAGAHDLAAAYARVEGVSAEIPGDLPFALLYEVDAEGLWATRCAHAGVDAPAAPAPRRVDLLSANAPWPLGQAVRQRSTVYAAPHGAGPGDLRTGTRDEAVGGALVVPLRSGEGDVRHVLVAGLSARLPFDDAYRDFIELFAQQAGSNLAQARLREQERERLAQLAELDRARTEFFSNVSHEFRTPLTMILAPLEDALTLPETAAGPLREELDMASRNARRLLSLVDTLLDFSRIEAGRLRPGLVPTDLAALTLEIARLFRPAIERAGLHFEVDCPPLPRAVPVDPAMWERIVSNLLSNALKFTFEGTVTLRLRELPQHVQLDVSDTGVGISPDEQPHVFRRFHRVRGTRARTEEGAGIGLAMVDELVRLHRGRVRVSSEPGRGTTFTLWLNVTDVGLRPASEGEPVRAGHPLAAQLAQEAGRWIDAPAKPPQGVLESMVGPAGEALPVHQPGAHVLVVDDDADMREYLARTLGERWRVTLAASGDEALALARQDPPDLMLADVLMPGLDGFSLLRAWRADRELGTVPLILLTARVNEEAAIEGILAGADDYLTKPFSSRELVARVGAQLELSHVRRQGEQEVRELLALVPVGVYACDREGRLGYHNRRAAELWGHEPDPDDTTWALCGGPRVLDATGDPVRADDSPVTRVLRSGEPLSDVELTLERADGARLELLLNIRPLRGPEGEVAGAICAFLDVSARKEAERELQALNEELERRVQERTAALSASEARLAAELAGARVLQRLSTSLLSEQQPQALHGQVLAAAMRLLGADAASIQLLEPGGERMVVLAARNIHPQSQEYWQHVDASPASPRVPSFRLAGRVLVEDVEASAELAGTRDLEEFRRSGLRAVQSTPLVSRSGRPIGLISTHWRSPRRLHDLDFNLFDVLVRQLADLLERSQAEEALRASEERQAFLLELSDALRPLADPVAIQETASRMTAEHLDIGRVAYCEIRYEPDIVVIVERDWPRRGMPSVAAGRYRMDDFGPFMTRELTAGRPAIVADATSDPRISGAERENWSQLDITASCAVPVMKEARFVAYLVAQDNRRHDWTGHELALLREVSERTWAAVERARAEDALRESEAKYRTLFETMGQGYCELELIRDADGRAVDQLYLELNPAFERLFGIPVAQARGHRASEVMPGLEPSWHAAFDRVARSGVPERLEQEVASYGRWFEVFTYPRGGDRLTVLYEDVTERKHAEDVLRASEERQTFLLRLSDALRPLSDPIEIQSEAARVLGHHFGAGRAAYAEIEADNVHFTVHRDYTDGVPSFAGRYPFEGFGARFFAELRTGRTVCVTDAPRDPKLSEAERTVYAAIMVRAAVGVPLIKGGRLAALFFLHFPEPHEWTPGEVALVEEVAERTWAAVERARAEEALRTSERRTHIQNEAFQSAMNGEPLARSLNTLTRIVKEQLGGDVRTAFYLAYPDGTSLHAIDGAGDMPQTYTGPLDGFPVGDASFCSGYAIASGHPALTPDILEDPRWQPYLGLASAHHFRSASSYPILTAEGKAVGSFAMYFAGVHEASAQEFAVAEAITQAAAIILSRHTEAVERERAEVALRESEEKYRTLFETMDEGFALCELVRDADGHVVDYRYLELNSALVRHSGLTPEALRGRRATEALPNLDRGLIDTYARLVAEGESMHTERHFPHVDRWLRVNAYPRGGDHFAVLYGDITEQKRAELALRASEERQAFLLKLSDTLRPLAEPAAIQAAATRLLRERFDAGWCYYTEYDEAGTVATILADAARAGLPSLVGRHDVSDVPEFIAFRRSGQLFNAPDLASYERLSPRIRERYTRFGVRSLLGVALAKERGPLSTLIMGDTAPRHWPQEAVDLLGEVAERTWAAVERARAEAALRESEAKYRTLFESIDEGFVLAEVMYDESGQPVDALYLEGNPAASGMTGVPDYTHRCLSEVVPGFESYWLEIYDRVARTGRSERLEQYAAPLGRWYNFYVFRIEEPAVRGSRRVAVIFQDITRRKQYERRQEFLLGLSDALRSLGKPAEIQAAATESLREYFSAGWCFYAEWDEHATVGEVLRDATREGLPSLAGRHDVSDVPEFLDFLRSGQEVCVSDCASYERLTPRIRERYGAVGFCSMLGTPLLKEGHLVATLMVGDTEPREWPEDATTLVREVANRTWSALERARAENALRALNATLEERVEERTRRLTDLNSELRALAAASSRELNEPLRRLRGFLQLLERRAEGGLDDQMRRYLGLIQAEAQRAEALAESFRALAHLEHRDLKPSRVPLTPLVMQIRSDLAPALGARRVKWTVGELPVVEGDPLLLRQAFTELVHHALRLVPGTSEARVEVGAEPSADGVCVTVAVAPLDPGATTLDGNGLSTARRVAQRHGGTLDVNTQGEVARFVIQLPARLIPT
ncbi:protein-glutamate methylesterase/protein-glutamine glutaminase [Deinococcus carri]|uniref:histidine kinase n=1 Tax=Deinococcus carri TaxID=1211323 RepID=A0ABP9W9B8_9DEIO